MEDFADFNAQLQRALMSTMRSGNGIPGPSDLSYQRTLSRPTGKKIDETSKRLLSVTSKMLGQARQATEHIGSSTSSKGKGKTRAVLEHEDLVDRYEANVVSITDNLLELMDTNLDQHARSLAKAAQSSVTVAPVASTSKAGSLSSDLRHSANLVKPQLSFAYYHSNARDAVFTPLISEKLHSRHPLDNTAVSYVDEKTGRERTRIPNPYAQEIEDVLSRPLPSITAMNIDSDGQQMESAMDSKPFSYIDNVEGLHSCLDLLKRADTIAVDLEHHDHRSFRGITCLIQISTIEHDFVIDPLVPEVRSSLQMLNEVFVDPAKVKVLHGADSDIIWLQRDFGLYIVNLFDTFFASRALQRKGHSLASLLTEYTTFSPDKRYQLADWRIRPLTDEMLKYARSDTHFLIYIYERLRRDPLMTADMLSEVRRKSSEVAKQAYEHLQYDKEDGYGQGGWRNPIERSGKAPLWGLEEPVAGAQKWINKHGVVALEVFKAVHDWRDRLARELDEGIGFILPNRSIFTLAETPPRDEKDLANKLQSNYAPHVRERKDELLRLISDAVDRGMTKADELRQQAEKIETAPASTSLWASNAGQAANIASLPQTSSTSSLFGPLTAGFSGNAAFSSILAKVHADILGPLAASLPIPEEERDEVIEEAIESSGSAIRVLDADEDATSSSVPATPKSGGWEADDIVSVTGKKKEKGKKRKHPDPVSAAKAEVEPYDFSKKKSILDAPRPAKEDFDPRNAKKQKKDRKGGPSVDGFKPAPKSMNQPKSGNKSHTFT